MPVFMDYKHDSVAFHIIDSRLPVRLHCLQTFCGRMDARFHGYDSVAFHIIDSRLPVRLHWLQTFCGKNGCPFSWIISMIPWHSTLSTVASQSVCISCKLSVEEWMPVFMEYKHDSVAFHIIDSCLPVRLHRLQTFCGRMDARFHGFRP